MAFSPLELIGRAIRTRREQRLSGPIIPNLEREREREDSIPIELAGEAESVRPKIRGLWNSTLYLRSPRPAWTVWAMGVAGWLNEKLECFENQRELAVDELQKAAIVVAKRKELAKEGQLIKLSKIVWNCI